MIEQTGLVTRSDSASARVSVPRRQICDGCGLKSSCGSSLVGRALGYQSAELELANTSGVKVGDDVRIRIHEHKLLSIALLVYGLPLVAMLSAGVLAVSINAPDLYVALVSAIAMAAGFFLVKRISPSIERHNSASEIISMIPIEVHRPGALRTKSDGHLTDW